MNGKWIRRPSDSLTVIFLHGILSDGDSCWKHPNGTYWPDLLAREQQLTSIGLYVFEYKTGIFSGTYRLGDVVDTLHNQLRLDGVQNSKQLVFVCHSMGGIIARRLLVQRQLDLVEADKEIGLFLIASPSLGTRYAQWLSLLARKLNHTQADALRFAQDNAWLMDLDRDFLNLKEAGRLRLRGKELVEDQFVILPRLWRLQVVEPFSAARYFGDPLKVANSDHFSIVKIPTADAIQHKLLVEFIEGFSVSLTNEANENEPADVRRNGTQPGAGAPNHEQDHHVDLVESKFFSPSVRKHLDALNRHVEFLTQDQYRVIRLLRSMRRVRIAGCAGSGKTLVAVEKACRLAASGIKTLFLCHSPLLARHVASLVHGTPVVVWSFGEWLANLANDKGSASHVLWTNYDEPDTATLNAAFDVLVEISNNGFDAVIVDEGQDFRPDWWAVVEASLAPCGSGILYIFHDDHQALLPHRAGYPIDEPELDLSRNCRNAGNVFELVRYFHPQAPETEIELRGMGKLRLIRPSIGEERESLRVSVNDLMRDGAEFPQIVIVVGGGEIGFDTDPIWAPMAIPAGSRFLQRWQDSVIEEFVRVTSIYNQVGITMPVGGMAQIRSVLSKLSDDPIPNAEDVSLVRGVAKRFAIDIDIRRRIRESPRFRDALHWSASAGRTRLIRKDPSFMWSAEVVLHFESPEWHTTLPPPRYFSFVPQRRGIRNEVGVFDIASFKGLESEFVILLSRGHRPMITQEIYVAVSRALYSLTIVDCGGNIFLPGNFLRS